MASINLEVVPGPNDSAGVIRWLINEGILKEEMICPKCIQKMELMISKKIDDPLCLECLNQECSGCERLDEIAYRIGSYFEKFTVNLATWINILKGWCYEDTQYKVTSDVGLKYVTEQMIYERCRKLCRDILLKDSIKFKNTVICAEVKKLSRVEETYLLVMVDFIANPVVGYMQTYGNEDTASLFSMIESVVIPSSKVFIENFMSLANSILPRNFHLANLNTNSYAQKVLKSYIDFHKKVIDKIQEAYVINPQEYLYEAMWRERFPSQRFKTFIDKLNNL